MRCAINLVVLGALLLGSGASPSEASAGQPAPLEAEWTSALDREIAELRRRFKGRIAVYVSDPTLGITYRHDAEAPIYIASGVKVPFMIEVFRQAELGLLSMDETIRVEAGDLRDGARGPHGHDPRAAPHHGAVQRQRRLRPAGQPGRRP